MERIVQIVGVVNSIVILLVCVGPVIVPSNQRSEK